MSNRERGGRESSSRDSGGSSRVRDTGGRDTGRGSSRGGSSFEYQKRDPSSMKKRGEQSANDFDRIFIDDVNVFKVNDGNNFIRFLPPTWKNPEHFGLDIYVHYGIGPDNQTYLCLHKMKGEACPICEEAKRAQDDGDDDYAKKLKPNKRVLVYIIDRDNEKEGVKAWSMPWTVDRDVCKVSVDKRTGETLELDNPEDGYDVEFEKKGQKQKTEYLGIAVARRSSELGDDKWLDYAKDFPLDTILNYFDYDHIQAAFGGAGKSATAGRGKDDDLDREQERGLNESQSGNGREQSKVRSHDQDYDWDKIHGMTFDEMSAVVEDQKLGIDPEQSKDDEDLADWICDEMKIDKVVKPAASSRRAVTKEPEKEESSSDRLRRLRQERDR